jgi:hypothetical protein
MNLSDVEKKLLMLAMDKAAQEPEVVAAAKKFILSLRKRFPSGIELIDALEGKLYSPNYPNVPRATPSPFPSGVRPFGYDPYQPPPPVYQQTANEWAEILRQAQRQAAQRMAQAQAQRQQTWEEYCRANNFHPYQNAYRPENVQQQQSPPPPPKGTGIMEKMKKYFK